MLALVLQQVGLPVEGIILIMAVDPLLDMARTAVNVTGDTMKILVINPFATDRYDEVVRGVCERAKRSDTRIDIQHIVRGLPFIRYRYFQALIVPEIVELCICAEKDGFDGWSGKQ